MQKVIVLAGYGIMGQGIVKNINYYTPGIKIYLYKSHIHILESDQLKMVDNMKEVKNDIYAIISCLPDDDATKEFWKSSDVCDAIKKTHCYCIELSTGSYKQVMENSKIIENLGGKYVESPMTGSRIGANQKNLTLFVHNRYADELRSFFRLFSENIVTFNDLGNATKFKLLYNSWGLSILYTLKVFYPYILNFGEDISTVVDAFSKYGWMSSMCKDKLQYLMENDTKVNYKFKHMLKDIKYGNELFSFNDILLQKIYDSYNEMAEESNLNNDYVDVVVRGHNE